MNDVELSHSEPLLHYQLTRHRLQGCKKYYLMKLRTATNLRLKLLKEFALLVSVGNLFQTKNIFKSNLYRFWMYEVIIMSYFLLATILFI